MEIKTKFKFHHITYNTGSIVMFVIPPYIYIVEMIIVTSKASKGDVTVSFTDSSL
jgi:hypothetical protein